MKFSVSVYVQILSYGTIAWKPWSHISCFETTAQRSQFGSIVHMMYTERTGRQVHNKMKKCYVIKWSLILTTLSKRWNQHMGYAFFCLRWTHTVIESEIFLLKTLKLFHTVSSTVQNTSEPRIGYRRSMGYQMIPSNVFINCQMYYKDWI